MNATRSVLPTAAGILLAALLPACGDGGSAPPPAKRGPRPVTVTVAPVVTRPITYLVRGIGALEAYQVVTVSARMEGALEGVSFDEGDAVTPDRVLATIDGPRRGLLVKIAEAAIARLAAAIPRVAAQEASALASLAEAEANLARREKMRSSGVAVVSDEEFASYQAQVARLKAAVDQTRAEQAEAKASLEEGRTRLAVAERDRKDAEVRAPIAGVVDRKHVAEGQHVKAGDAVATIVDAKRLRLRFRVTTAESVRLAKDLDASFRTNALPGRTFRAKIFHVGAEAADVTRMVEYVAEVTDPDPALKPGFFAEVSVETGGGRPAIVVPEDAVLPSESGWTAYVVVDGKARRRTPVLGLRTSDGGVEVLSGLEVGESLVVRGAASLSEGLPVAVAPDAKAPAVAPAGGGGPR